MVKTYCDICGEEKPTERRLVIVKKGWRKLTSLEDLDFCQDCITKIEKAQAQVELDIVMNGEWRKKT